MRKYLLLLAILAAAFLASILSTPSSSVDAHAPPTRITWPTMGTEAAISFRAVEDDCHGAILAEVQSVFARHEALLSAWNPKSELSMLKDPSQWSTAASAEVRPCYEAAFRLMAFSQRAFNPFVGKILRTLEPHKRCFTADFDLGAIAKGFSVDVAALGIGPNDLLLDLGGNLKSCGGTWETGIRDPFHAGKLAATFTLTNGEATATSGNYERFIVVNGVRKSHILDGRTGTPTQGIAATIVVHPSKAMLADGLSTTLFILGPQEGAAFLQAHYPEAAAVWIPDTPESPRLIATPTFAPRLKNLAYPLTSL